MFFEVEGDDSKVEKVLLLSEKASLCCKFLLNCNYSDIFDFLKNC